MRIVLVLMKMIRLLPLSRVWCVCDLRFFRKGYTVYVCVAFSFMFSVDV